MRIAEITTYAVKWPHHYSVGDNSPVFPGTDYFCDPRWRHGYSRKSETCLVQVHSDDGQSGWGEAQSPLVPEVAAALIARLYGPALIGRELIKPEILFDDLYRLNNVRGHVGSHAVDAIAGLDIALWDLHAKASNARVRDLIGPVLRPKIPLYASGINGKSHDERRRNALAALEAGFTGMKLFLPGDVKTVLETFDNVRSVADGKAWVAIDTINAPNYDEALQIGQHLDRSDAAWFEAPVDVEDISTTARLARQVRTPIAVGEALRTLRAFEPWWDAGAIRISQPDIGRCGITGILRIAREAHRRDQRVGLHVGLMSSIAIAASWQVASTLPDSDLAQEHQTDLVGVISNMLVEPLTIGKGYAVLPDSPGLGIDVNEKEVLRHCTERLVINADGTRRG